MTDSTDEQAEQGYPSMIRRERLERIASAERDRRAGRVEVAIATIGEPIEWPARAVLALARLTQTEAETRRLLEEGLERWARELGLGDLAESVVEDESDPLGLVAELESKTDVLDSPLDSFELDRAFAQAEAEVESMHDVNDVAGRVLMDEPIGFAELAGDELTPVEESTRFGAPSTADRLGMDAAFVEYFPASANPAHDSAADAIEDGNAFDVLAASDTAVDPSSAEKSRRQMTIATLESWLQNLEQWKARRTQ